MINIRRFLGLEAYVSPLDQFLKCFNKTHPKLSSAQLKEKEKYQKIFKLRDQKIAPAVKDQFWDKF